MSEEHLFIIWSNALDKKNEIIEDIGNNFKILSIYNVCWSSSKFSENLTRLYGQYLPDASFKQKHCGDGAFLLIVVNVEKPEYIEIDIGNGRGLAHVNKLVYEKKKLYRKWTGGGHKIHATNDSYEFSHDCYLLLGEKYVSKSYRKGNQTHNVVTINEDLIGSNGWESLNDFRYALNNYKEYVILRGDFTPQLYDGIEDLDILVYDMKDFSYFINAKHNGKKFSSMRHTVLIDGNVVHIDINSVGDGCYDLEWQENMLKNKIISNELYYLNFEDSLQSVTYHNIVHKRKLVSNCKKNALVIFLNANKFKVTVPKDFTVTFDCEIFEDSLVKYEREGLKRKLFNFFQYFRVGFFYVRKSFL